MGNFKLRISTEHWLDWWICFIQQLAMNTWNKIPEQKSMSLCRKLFFIAGILTCHSEKCTGVYYQSSSIIHSFNSFHTYAFPALTGQNTCKNDRIRHRNWIRSFIMDLERLAQGQLPTFSTETIIIMIITLNNIKNQVWIKWFIGWIAKRGINANVIFLVGT